MGMHMQTTLFMRTQQFDSSLAFLGLHTGYMGHGHAPGLALLIIRAVGVYAYDAGGVPLRSTTCVGAACTSSIELTCSRTCGRMAIAHGHAYANDVVMRTQQFDSSLAFLGLHTGYMGMGHGTWACTRPNLAHNPRGWCVCI